MPYYVIPVSEVEVVAGLTYFDMLNRPEEFAPFAVKTEATAHIATNGGKGFKLVFKASQVEQHDWRNRELSRFDDSESGYVHVPWSDDLHGWNDYQTLYYHYAHVSLKDDGMVAYTPDDMFGHEGRHLRTTPGKYLKQFAPHLDCATVEAYCNKLKAYGEGFKVATSAKDIHNVYRNGPNSCMSHNVSDYSSRGVHPTSVYGDSDLALAYLGDSESKVSARCLIWPDKKQFNRVYGDGTLTVMLQAQGYEYTSSFDGARIRRIKVPDSDVYVMPYLDCASGVKPCSDGQYFTLSNEYQCGYQINNTTGVSGSLNTCLNCDSSCGEDESYCESCQDDRWTCETCNEDYFDGQEQFTITTFSEYDRTVCESCESQYSETCTVCDEGFTTMGMSTRDARARREIGTDEMCRDCASNHSYCSEHSELYHDDDECSECAEETRKADVSRAHIAYRQSAVVLRVHRVAA